MELWGGGRGEGCGLDGGVEGAVRLGREEAVGILDGGKRSCLCSETMMVVSGVSVRAPCLQHEDSEEKRELGVRLRLVWCQYSFDYGQ